MENPIALSGGCSSALLGQEGFCLVPPVPVLVARISLFLMLNLPLSLFDPDQCKPTDFEVRFYSTGFASIIPIPIESHPQVLCHIELATVLALSFIASVYVGYVF